MNRRFFIAWIVVFIAWFPGSFVVHGVLLDGDYMALPELSAPRRTPRPTSRR